MYDLIIIGGGPAAMSAAIYAARYRVSVLVLASEVGGAITGAHDVQNYPGFDQISGMDLMAHMRKQVEFQGVEIKIEEVKEINKKDGSFKINSTYDAKTILFATGTQRRKLNIPGEKDYAGKGVSYCATCDAPFFKGKVVGVVGGSNSAAMAAQLLAQYAEKVHIIYRKDALRAEPARVESLENNPKINFIYNNNVLEIHGTKFMEGVKLENPYDESNEIAMNGLFIEIGSTPSTFLADSLGVDLNEQSFINVDAAQRTNIKGIYAAGDITTNSNGFRQLVTATSEGAIAAHSVYNDIKHN